MLILYYFDDIINVDNCKQVINVTVDQVVRLAKQQPPFISTEPNVLAVSWMAVVCSRSNDERCACVRALTADNDKCDSCSIDIVCDGHVRTIYIFFDTYVQWRIYGGEGVSRVQTAGPQREKKELFNVKSIFYFGCSDN